jgi:hypothetical protein
VGRLPLQYAGKDITLRIPYSMTGEATYAANLNGQVMQDTLFGHQMDKPLEVHRMIVRLTAFEAGGAILEPQPTTLDRRVQIRVKDTATGENMNKAAQRLSSLKKINEDTWEWEEPRTITKNEGFEVSVDTGPYNMVPAPANATTAIRVEVTFQGYLIVIAPPTETR